MHWTTLQTHEFLGFPSVKFDACIAHTGFYQYVLLNEYKQQELSNSLMMVLLELELFCRSSNLVLIARFANTSQPVCLRQAPDIIGAAEVMPVPEHWMNWVEASYSSLDQGGSLQCTGRSLMEAAL